jgi:uncharacterized protein (DUF305 family)
MNTRYFAVAVALAAATTLAGCGGEAAAPAGHGDKSSAPAAPATQHNEHDVTFAQGMIPHHQQALEMVALVEERATSADVKQLGKDIAAAQGPEIEKMRGWLRDWGVPESAGHGGDHGGHAGMLSEAEMKELEAAKGTKFDRALLTLMIKHHEGAVTSARAEQSSGASPAAKKLAGDIVTSQTAEIKKMRGMLEKL